MSAEDTHETDIPLQAAIAADGGRTSAAPPPFAVSPASVVALQRIIGNRATGRMIARWHQSDVSDVSRQTGPSLAPSDDARRLGMIQRKVVWFDGPRARTRDLVDPLTEFKDFGVTPGKINNTEFPGGDAATAILPPALQFQGAMLGLTSASVGSEPTNRVGYRMELPKAPPWQTTVATDQIRSRLRGEVPPTDEPALDQYAINVKGQTNLRAKGLPSDQEFVDLVEQHEEHHVDDMQGIVDRVLRPWDDKLSKFKKEGASFRRWGQESAKQALYASAGGTSAEIGQKLENEFRTHGEGFHATVEGGPPTVGRVDIDEAGSTLTVYWKHPLG